LNGSSSNNENEEENEATITSTNDTQENQQQNEINLEQFQQRQMLKLSLLLQAKNAQRGFDTTKEQRIHIEQIIQQLAKSNPTKEPAKSYYENNNNKSNTNNEPDLAGKWTLIYTDAPDITSLDANTNNNPILASILPSPPPTAKLGRIGQECDSIQSTITNVIEWKKPDWITNIFSNMGTSNDNEDEVDEEDNDNNTRILQKVKCQAKANPNKPCIVQLTLVGLELVGTTSTSSNNMNSNNNFLSSLLSEGPATILSKNPITVEGPLKVPFGQFEILYLDEEIRIIQTGQGYYAVNMRENKPWF